MTEQINHTKKITIALAWCLAWGDRREPQFNLETLQKMRDALKNEEEVPIEVRSLVDQVQLSQNIDFPESLHDLQKNYPDLWNQATKIGLVYGGATKIKQYVFEAAKLSDIRGASALLDRINLVDIPAFFGHYDGSLPKSANVEDCLKKIEEWLEDGFPKLSDALIPELLIYYKGGNVLAFCPAAFVDDLANAIERRYTEETLAANSCAVGQTFNLLEVRFGLLNNAENFWLDSYLKNYQNPLVEAYFGGSKDANKKAKAQQQLREAFIERKNFNELVTSLAIAFNQRRSGNTTGDRPSRAYPPIFETHPYLVRDESDRRPAVFKPKSEHLPNEPNLSESLARKKLIGQIAKREKFQDHLPKWYLESKLDWNPLKELVDSWVYKFAKSIGKKPHRYYQNVYDQKNRPSDVDEARSLREISKASDGFVGYIYADGNNMGGYIQKRIKTPEDYQQFSKDIFDATEQSVYYALAEHVKPIKIKPDPDSDRMSQDDVWIHPFEIITIGGDDVLLIVPANKALEVARAIGEKFEEILTNTGRYSIPDDDKSDDVTYQRYCYEKAMPSQCCLSTSIGVLITADNTPIYYADKLVTQLLKSAKEKAKSLKNVRNSQGELLYSHFGGTIDFLSMKSVTMLSSNVKEFRKEGLTKGNLRFYAAPYTLHEIDGLVKVVRVLKKANFPKAQLYQLRSLLENGKQTAIINYRYFRVRLKDGQSELKIHFEDAWCKPKTNNGSLAPWMSVRNDDKVEQDKTVYETIWRDLVDIYDFVEIPEDTKNNNQAQQEVEV
jgi:CRISPR-associated protein Cmr2